MRQIVQLHLNADEGEKDLQNTTRAWDMDLKQI